MDFQAFLSPDIQDFIRSIEHEDPGTIALKKMAIAGYTPVFLAEQVAGRRKAREKLPAFYQNTGIVYPPGVNLEQSSSEATAKFKAQFIQQAGLRGYLRFADLTAGFGVDSFYLSTIFGHGDVIEPNALLLDITTHNHAQLGVASLDYHNTGAEGFLRSTAEVFDLIYIDPSRRVTGNQKVYTLTQSEPDVVALQKEIFEKTDHLLIKTSPLLDIQVAMKELTGVKHVAVVSVDNDCKELLFFCEKGFAGEAVIDAVNLISSHGAGTFSFLYSEERSTLSAWSDPLTYLYEPNASILKAGAFRLVGTRYVLYKLHASTHLYTSDRLVPDFPGRVFKVLGLVKPDPKSLKEFFPEGKANVMTRNYPMSVAELKKRTKLDDGGDRYLIGFSGKDKKLLAVAERIS